MIIGREGCMRQDWFLKQSLRSASNWNKCYIERRRFVSFLFKLFSRWDSKMFFSIIFEIRWVWKTAICSNMEQDVPFYCVFLRILSESDAFICDFCSWAWRTCNWSERIVELNFLKFRKNSFHFHIFSLSIFTFKIINKKELSSPVLRQKVNFSYLHARFISPSSQPPSIHFSRNIENICSLNSLTMRYEYIKRDISAKTSDIRIIAAIITFNFLSETKIAW